MVRNQAAPHPDTLDAALPHYNDAFRLRYRLPPITEAQLRNVIGFEQLFSDVEVTRSNGVADASCAAIARVALSRVPRYAIGIVAGQGKVAVIGPDVPEDAPFLVGQVLLVNPLGGEDNWAALSRWFHSNVAEDGRRRALAGLASELRRDYSVIDPALREAAATHGRGTTVPPSEAFSSERAAEVSYIYDVPVETLRAWKQRYRAERAARRPGAPRRNR